MVALLRMVHWLISNSEKSVLKVYRFLTSWANSKKTGPVFRKTISARRRSKKIIQKNSTLYYIQGHYDYRRIRNRDMALHVLHMNFNTIYHTPGFKWQMETCRTKVTYSMIRLELNLYVKFEFKLYSIWS